MLVLTRKSEEKILIGKKIVVTVLKVQDNQVSLGIEAPADMTIYREELLREIEAANTGGVVPQGAADVKTLAKNLRFKNKKPRSNKPQLEKAGTTDTD